MKEVIRNYTEQPKEYTRKSAEGWPANPPHGTWCHTLDTGLIARFNEEDVTWYNEDGTVAYTQV